MRASSFQPDDLLAHTGWLRRLALELVSDEHQAEDLVQDTFLAALGSPPRAAEALRVWLATVARRLAHEKRRGRAHRQAREAQQARAEALPSTAELAEEMEAGRALLAELMELPEPYRSTLLLRYYRELPTAEIAERQGLPAGTVRARISRGTALLRERMERRDQGLLALAAGLGSLQDVASLGMTSAAPLATSAATPLLSVASGILIMNVFLKLALVFGLAGLAYLGWTQLTPEEVTHVTLLEPTAEEQAPVLEDLAAEVELQSESSEEAAEEARQVMEAAAATPERAAPAIEETKGASISGRFVDVAGVPQPGVLVQVSKEARSSEGVRGMSDSDGRFVLDLEIKSKHARNHYVRWGSAPFAKDVMRVPLQADDERSLGTIVLEAGGDVEGRVLDPDGRPLDGVKVSIRPAELWDQVVREEELDQRRRDILARLGGSGTGDDGPWRCVAKTDEQGRYRLEGVPAGQELRVWAHKKRRRHGWSTALRVAPGEVRRGIDVQLESLRPEDRIAGKVIDPDGETVPFASVEFKFSDSDLGMTSSVRAQQNGKFEIILSRAVPHLLKASDPDRILGDVSLAEVQPGDIDLVLQLRSPEEGVLLTVHDTAGDPVPRIELFQVEETANGSHASHLGWKNGEGGEYRFYPPATTFSLVVEAKGYGSAQVGPFRGGHVPQGKIAVTLNARPAVSGVVLSAGQPVAGARVELAKLVPDEQGMSSNGFVTRFHRAKGHTTTDAEGRFQVYPEVAGSYALRAYKDDVGWAETDPLRFNVDNPSAGHRLELEAFGDLVVQVQSLDGREVAGTIIGANRFDGEGQTAVADEQGRATFLNLAPGGWRIDVRKEERKVGVNSASQWDRPEGSTPDWSTTCTVKPGERLILDYPLGG